MWSYSCSSHPSQGCSSRARHHNRRSRTSCHPTSLAPWGGQVLSPTTAPAAARATPCSRLGVGERKRRFGLQQTNGGVWHGHGTLFSRFPPQVSPRIHELLAVRSLGQDVTQEMLRRLHAVLRHVVMVALRPYVRPVGLTAASHGLVALGNGARHHTS